jgi:hypothetical protein
MYRTYQEELYTSDMRFEERRSFFRAQRERRVHLYARNTLAAIFWIFGAR